MSAAPQKQSFDYSSLDDETKTAIQEHTKQIQSRMLGGIVEMVAIGQHLQAVKQRLKHGLFHDWLRSELGMHPRQANRLVSVARQFICDNLSQMDITPSALYLLAEQQTHEAARNEAISLAQQGRTITLKVAKEIIYRHKADAVIPKESQNLNYPPKANQSPENTIDDIPTVTIPNELPHAVIMHEGVEALIFRLLSRRCGEIPPELKMQIQALSLSQLEDLGEALLDFSRPNDLVDWLQNLQ